MHCVEQRGPCPFGEVADPFLNNPILEVSVDPAEGHRLVVEASMVKEQSFSKSVIVCMIIADGNPKGSGICFKSSFSKECLCPFSRLLQVHIGKSAVVIHKYSHDFVALAEEVAFVLSNKTRDRRLKLINRNTSARLSHRLDLVGVTFGPPWLLCGLSVKAELALRNSTGCKSLRYFPSGSHQSNVSEGEMTQTAMPSHELGQSIEFGGGIIMIRQICMGIIMIQIEWYDHWSVLLVSCR
jgi:hypothetical protein